MNSAQELKNKLAEASQLISIGDTYTHYKNPANTYTITNLIVIEATEEVGVVYKAEYKESKDISFVRPIDNFLAMVVNDGEDVPRFAKQ